VAGANGKEIVDQAVSALARERSEVLSPTLHQGASPQGRSYSRKVYADTTGQPRVESWVLHGASHAWSGGHASGSFTDATGADASAEMVRFFLAQTPAGTA